MTRPSKPLKTLNTNIWQHVAKAITHVVTQAIILIALADFFALKYRHANCKYIKDDELRIKNYEL